METTAHNTYGPDGPEIEPTLLLRFLIQRYDELLESDHPRINLTLGGLSLTGVARDEEAEKELNYLLYPASHPHHTLLTRCREIFMRTLARTEEGQLRDSKAKKEGRFPSLDERTCREILITALREGRRLIKEKRFEYAKILQSIGWIALQCYPRRLAEFEDAWIEEDPEQSTRRGVEILWTAFRQRDRE